MKKWFPWIVAVVLGGWAVGSFRMPADRQWAIRDFGRLPVLSGGRVQPLDSLARNSLLQIREKQAANFEPWKNWWQKPKLISATEWAMLVMMKPAEADTWPVFRIDHPDVKNLLALPADADAARQTDGKHFSWAQIEPKLPELRREAARASEKEASQRNPYEQALLHLWNGRVVYTRLKNALGPAATGDLESARAEFDAKVEAGRVAYSARMNKQPFDEPALQWLNEQIDAPIIVPGPATAGDRRHDGWSRVSEALIRAESDGRPAPAPILGYARIAAAYRAGNATAFNTAVADLRHELARDFAPELAGASHEQWFNHGEPFYKSLILYVATFLLVLAYWMTPGADWLRRAAVACALVALAVHTGGLLTRMILQGRPPVTNLYSSAVFIGWGACVLGLVLERFWRNSIGLVVSSAVGFITLMIAHHLSLGADTMQMMEAVLDTNFWLATHVVIVTLGYASTFVAGFLGIVYVVGGVFSKALTPQLGRNLARMIFGILCFATLFSFVGTVLGGIWADQSWGRFWGWDPKENGAVIIVLWNVLILHARMGGVVKERGLMVLALGGNIVTSWSWFGVNLLGVGLHSYGFTSAPFKWLMLFVGTQLVLIALGLLPLRFWKSFRDTAPPAAGPSPHPRPARAGMS
ncbi:MAG: hypothetical protein QOF48_1147 [Verrucomicrobiota bacterium]|jgi:ABC-type transport system involved in cytochrome c biogenesis permease subunit